MRYAKDAPHASPSVACVRRKADIISRELRMALHEKGFKIVKEAGKFSTTFEVVKSRSLVKGSMAFSKTVVLVSLSIQAAFRDVD